MLVCRCESSCLVVDLPTFGWQYTVNIGLILMVMMMVFMMVNNNLLGGFSPLKNDGVRQLG